MSAFEVAGDAPAWERHPAGDELLYLVSGAVEVIFERPAGERRIALAPQTACVVPRGVWHRFVVHEPGLLIFLTPGAGTEHRAIARTTMTRRPTTGRAPDC